MGHDSCKEIRFIHDYTIYHQKGICISLNPVRQINGPLGTTSLFVNRRLGAKIMRVENTSMVHLGQGDCIRHERKRPFYIICKTCQRIVLNKTQREDRI